jgi:hypothetical protein
MVVAAGLLAQPAAPPDDPQSDALAGPSVSHAADSLVRINMESTLERLSMRPEQAAAERLVLDSEARERVRQVFEDHAASMRRLVLANIDVFANYAEALKPNDGGAVRRIAKDLYESWEHKEVRDPLRTALTGVLQAEQLARFDALVDEYWNAVLEWEARNAAKDRKKPPTDEEIAKARARAQSRLLMEQFRREVVAAYEATLRPVQRRLDNICSAVAASAEQRAQIRAALIRFTREGRLSGERADRALLAREVYGLLSEEQRVKMVEAAVGGM